MSDVLELASHLRELDDDALIAICRQSLTQASNAKDFFDLAEQLMQSKSIDSWLATQNSSRLESIIDASVPDVSKDPIFAIIRKRTTTAGDPLALKIRQALATPKSANSLKVATKSGSTTEAEAQRAADDAGIRGFLSVQGLTEFVIDLEHRYLREVAKFGLALPDVKRFGLHLGLGLDEVRNLWEIARLNDLTTTKDSRWMLGDMAVTWLGGSHQQRWMSAVSRWRELMAVSAAEEIAQALKSQPQRTFFDALTDIFPLADASAGSKVDKLCKYAELIGLTSNGIAQPWMLPALQGDLKKASAQIGKHMPQLQARVILQTDLSIVAPGPLEVAAEDRLREFAQAESIGLASHFRLTPLSVSYALERGHSIEQIRDSLVELSGMALPQPVEYLLNDVFRRFGRIKVVTDESGGGAYIKVADSTLAIELANDLRHRIIALRQIDPNTLYSKYTADVVYFTLRDYGHLAVRANQDDTVISPERINSQTEKVVAVDPVKALVSKLRSADNNSSDGENEMMLRQLQLAIKNKSAIAVSYLGKDGTEHRFILEPVAISNGRLRSRDKKADIERTLPLANIVKLELA